MVLRVLLVAVAAAALLVWKAESSSSSSANAGPQTVVALEGEDVILPCSFDISSTNEFPTIEWSKVDLSPDVVLLYRDGCEIQEMKNDLYEYRTSLVLKELRNGNVSLRLGALRYSDRGRYRCKIMLGEESDHVSEVELIVATVAMPTLSVMAVGSDGVKVLCDSGCWMPHPLLELLDDDEDLIHPQVLEVKRRSLTGCFTIQMKAELQSATRSVTCRVQQREFNHSRRTTVILPDLCLFHHRTVGVAVGITVVCCLLFFTFLVSLMKMWENDKKKKRSIKRQSTDETSVSIDAEDHNLLSSQGQHDHIDGGGANCQSQRGCSPSNSPSTKTPPTGSCDSTSRNVNRKRVLKSQEGVTAANQSDTSSSSPVSANSCFQCFANTSLHKHHPPPLTRQDSFSTAHLSASSSSSTSSEAPPVVRSLSGPTHGGLQSSNPALNKSQNGVAELSNKARKPDPQKQKVTGATPASATAPTVPVVSPATRSLTRTTHDGVQSLPPSLNKPQNSVTEPTNKVQKPDPQKQKVTAATPAVPVVTHVAAVLTPAARSLSEPTHDGVQSSPPPLNKPQNIVTEPTNKARKPDPQKQKVTAAAPATAPASAIAFRHLGKKHRNSSCPTLSSLNLRSNPTNRHVNPQVRRTSLHVIPQPSSNRYSTLANLPDSH